MDRYSESCSDLFYWQATKTDIMLFVNKREIPKVAKALVIMAHPYKAVGGKSTETAWDILVAYSQQYP